MPGSMKPRKDPDLYHYGAQALEWMAWRQVCLRLEEQGVDINAADDLARAIRLWGELLHKLRLAVPQYDDNAIKEAWEDYLGRWLEDK